MSTVSDQKIADSEPSNEPVYLQRSLKIPVVLVLLFWIAYFSFGLLDVSMFPRFLSRAGALGLALLGFVLWWLIRAPVRVSYRFLALGWIVVCGVISAFFMHRTVLPPAVFLLVLPLLLTLWTVWLLLTRQRSENSRLIGTLLLTGLLFIPGTLVRMEGLKGDGGSDFHWRWAKSAEDKFLEQAKATPTNRDNVPTEPLVASAEDWTEFRGPTRDGSVHGLKIATDWKQTPPKPVWRIRVGPSWSSVVIVNGLLFTQEQRGENEVVSCFDAATGNPVWVHEDNERFEEQMGGIGPRATPTFANGRIYSLGARGKLNCLDAATGSKIWSRDIMADGSAKLPTWGFSGSPLVVNKRVIVFAGGETEQALLAYDDTSGEIVWKKPAGSESYSSPQLMTIAGQPQVLFLGDKQLGGYEPESGKQLWSYSTSNFGRPVVQPRLVGDSQLLVSFIPDGGIARIEVKHQGDEWKASESWNSRDIKPDFSDFVHHQGHLYGFDGNIFCCVNLATGKREWKGGRYGAGQVLLLVDQPLLIVLTEHGELVLVGLNPDKHTELSRFQAIEGKTWNHPAIWKNRLFVRNAEEMACFELQPAG